MEFKLEDQERIALQDYICTIVKDAVKRGTNNSRPFLNRKDIASFYGVAPTTIDNWVRLGMPVIVIDGRKLYSKDRITNWLNSLEKQKKPSTMHIVEDIQNKN